MPERSDEFNLTELVQAVIDETDLASPHEIADKVTESVPAEHLRDALRKALPHYVRVMVQRDRMHRTGDPDLAGGTTPRGAGRPPQRSAKVAAIRNAAPGWAKALRERIHVGASRWKLLADCTYDDLRFAADERQNMAARNAAVAERFDRLAALVQRHEVNRVSDLPDAVLAAGLDVEDAA